MDGNIVFKTTTYQIIVRDNFVEALDKSLYLMPEEEILSQELGSVFTNDILLREETPGQWSRSFISFRQEQYPGRPDMTRITMLIYDGEDLHCFTPEFFGNLTKLYDKSGGAITKGEEKYPADTPPTFGDKFRVSKGTGDKPLIEVLKEKFRRDNEVEPPCEMVSREIKLGPARVRVDDYKLTGDMDREGLKNVQYVLSRNTP